MAADHREQAEVEQEHRRPQPAALEELGRARRPAELVVAVAPDVADHEHRHRDVGQDDPQQQVDRGSSGASRQRAGAGAGPRRTGSGITSGGAKGSRPTASPGGPSRGQAPQLRALVRAAASGSIRQSASSSAA